jgi:hypothetical protein
MDNFFGCEICTKKIKDQINFVLRYDTSEVTLNDHKNKTEIVMCDKTIDEIKTVAYDFFLKNNHICNKKEHVEIAYGNDGPFFSLVDDTGKYKLLCSLLLNHENDTFRY